MPKTAAVFDQPKPQQSLCLESARRCAARARLDPRLDGNSAFDVLRCEGCPLHDDAMRHLLRLLPIALKRPVKFYRPGAQEQTFDERWLLNLLSSIRAGDKDSVLFALASRVDPRYRRVVRILAERCAERLDWLEMELW